ncbi:LacI family DNA-binding transcriptional regulator [Paenibacillus hamazuiensis]|uniref:LacI family DNA-binding transcriptional regulator n=1 Tax=Paenibacillus hamazuiensis TaxID=2936508 RepID=UPI00200C081A|nr:LacI family DNA-binding transcriptional regulator [Paenibacillus hamazuiensis]
MNNKPKVTIKDVALHAGVGLGTVSRAINGAPGISLKTKKKIFESIQQLGYIPDQTAQSMRSNKYKSIAFFIDISNVSFTQIAKGIQNELEDSGYTLSLCDIGHTNVVDKIASFLSGRNFDGIILSVPREDDEELQKLFEGVKIPIVTLDRDIPGLASGIMTDYYSSVKKAVSYLLSLGHEGIALVGGSRKIRPTKVSIQAYKEAFASFGKTAGDGLIREGRFSDESGRLIMLDLLPEIQRGHITALISLNNQMFHGILQTMRDNGLEYPKDLSIITVEDYELTKLLNPPVTVIRRPLLEMGASVARVLLKYLDEPDLYGTLKPVIVPTEFIVRESCRPV